MAVKDEAREERKENITAKTRREGSSEKGEGGGDEVVERLIFFEGL